MRHTPLLERVEEEVLRFATAGGDFDEVLRTVTAYQSEHNPRLAQFWMGRGVDVGTVSAGTIPGVPTDVFRSVKLVSVESDVTRVFRTSGTTSGARGEHHRLSTRVYDETCVPHFQRMLGVQKRRPFVALTFDPAEVSDSSLAHMVGVLHEACGSNEPMFHVKPETVDVPGAVAALEALGEPAVVVGTAFAFVHLFDEWSDSTRLPDGTVIIETGGFKGRSRVVEREELYGWFVDRLGVPLHRCVSEYSMTELSSQLWDDSVLSGNGDLADRRLVAPPWCRVIAVAPDTLEPLPRGEIGLLKFVDLANVDSVVAIQTSDLGRIDDRGVQLLGRASGATPRGCSMAIEEIIDRVAAHSHDG